MEEINQKAQPVQPPVNPPWQSYSPGEQTPPMERPFFPVGRKELWLGGSLLVCGLFLCNSVLMGGFNLGFALGALGVLLSLTVYLIRSGAQKKAYPLALLTCSALVAASYMRSGDIFVKTVLFFFLLSGGSLGLCLLAGKERRRPGGLASLLDGMNVLFNMGLGKLPEAFHGIRRYAKSSGHAGKLCGAMLLGLLAALPVAAILILLLTRADAAFSGLLEGLPSVNFSELIFTLIFGCCLAAVLYAQGTALALGPKEAPAGRLLRKGVSAVTINTVLTAVDLVYVVYLASQLAYFVGGFSGILPEDFTVAAYARRGFFEMAWLCALNLGIMVLAISLVEKTGRPPLSTRLLCLFVGVMTLFLVASASAKMFLYIGSFGLTRLRVLTEVIMVFLGLTTLYVCLWLFLPKLPYMKAVMLTGLLIGAAVAWADVDTVVAWYNVSAYQSGRLETVDMEHLATLSSGAEPYICRLLQDPDPQVAQAARDIVAGQFGAGEDFRSWNIADAAIIPPWM